MKVFLRWLARFSATALGLAAAIVLLPYASTLASRIMPLNPAASLREYTEIKREMNAVQKLVTMEVRETGVMERDYKISNTISVGNVTVSYNYTANFGIDLSKVSIGRNGNVITLTLPAPELLGEDSLNPDEIYRDTYWLGNFKDQDLYDMLDEEREKCREKYLTGEQSEALWAATLQAMENTVSKWMSAADSRITVNYVQAVPLNPSTQQ